MWPTYGHVGCKLVPLTTNIIQIIWKMKAVTCDTFLRQLQHLTFAPVSSLAGPVFVCVWGWGVSYITNYVEAQTERLYFAAPLEETQLFLTDWRENWSLYTMTTLPPLPSSVICPWSSCLTSTCLVWPLSSIHWLSTASFQHFISPSLLYSSCSYTPPSMVSFCSRFSLCGINYIIYNYIDRPVNILSKQKY